MNSKNIHINPNFIPKVQSKIHLNPSFVSALKQSVDSSHDKYTNFSQHPPVGPYCCEDAKSTLTYINRNIFKEIVTEEILTEYESSGFTDYSILNINTLKNDTFYYDKSSFKPNFSSCNSTDTLTKSLLRKPLANEPLKKVSHQSDLNMHNGKEKFSTSEYVNNNWVATLPAPAKFKISEAKSLQKTENPTTRSYYDSSKYKMLNPKKCDTKVTDIYRARYSLDKRRVKRLPAHASTEVSSINNLTSGKWDQEKYMQMYKVKKSSSSVVGGVDDVCPIVKQRPQNIYSLHKNGITGKLPITEKVQHSKIITGSHIHNTRTVDLTKSTLKPVDVPCIENLQTSNPSTKFNHNYSQLQIKNPKPFAFTSKLKLVRNVGSEKVARRKSNYAIKTKTKLIRRNSINSRFKKNNTSPNTPKIKKMTAFRKSFITRAKENRFKRTYGLNLRRSSTSQQVMRLRSKYKVINKPERGNEISKYRINRTQNSVRMLPPSFMLPSRSLAKTRRNPSKKSDKFINIEGNLYKSTRTSLKKQDLTAKTNRGIDIINSKVRSKKRSPRNSKFVYRRQSSTELQSGTLIEIVRRKKLAPFKKVNDYCFFYTKYGRCKKEKKGCLFLHDPQRVAVCTRFLQGSCPVKDCLFSHTLDKNKMPVCSHFLEGSCHREACPYRHVRVNPKAPLCRNFLKGHCPLGEECKNKHILICEEFKADGICPRGKSCPLSHRRRKTSSKKGKRKRSTSSSTSTSTSSSCKKKGKNKKLHPRRNGKIGVLGLEGQGSKQARERRSGPVGNTALGRYFDCAGVTSLANDQSSVTEETVVTETSKGEGQAGGPKIVERAESPTGKTCLEKKRERLMAKIEKLKRNYYDDDLNPGSPTGTTGNMSLLDVKTGLTPCGFSLPKYDVSGPYRAEPKTHLIERNSTCLQNTVHPPDVTIKLRFRSLPEVLPLYIPLELPEDANEQNLY